MKKKYFLMLQGKNTLKIILKYFYHKKNLLYFL